MDEYKATINILNNVYNGKNLNEELFEYKSNANIAKIRFLVYGVIRNYFLIKFYIKNITNYISKQNEILVQIGIFELNESNKPEYAIVNNLVSISNINNKKFINWVLREYQRNLELLRKLAEKDYSIKYNIPNWMIDILKKQYKKEYMNFLEGFNFHPAFGLRVNIKNKSLEDYLSILDNNDIKYKLIKNKIYLKQPLNVEDIPNFNIGDVSIQDIAAQYLVDILNRNNVIPKKVIDACAAPGGKTCQILENYNCDIIALDISNTRLEKVNQNLKRLNLKAEVLVGNAANKDWWNTKKVDLIVADVPCSASGTIKRNPDIKINRNYNDVLKFVETQRRIVINMWDCLEHNGFLLYITCSIFSEENQDNLLWFRDNIKGFSIIDELQIYPTEYNDSLYYALVKKIDL